MKRPEPIYFTGIPYTPMPRRVRPCRWVWIITDSQTGETLAFGTALTERAALRQRITAELRLRPEQERLDAIVVQLHEQGIDVEARYDEAHRVCVRAVCPCSDRDHRRVVRTFYAVVGPVRWGVAP